MEVLTSIGQAVVAGFSFSGAVLGLFWKLDDIFPRISKRVRRWVIRARGRHVVEVAVDWPRLFLDLFDALFNTSPKGYPSFLRSCVASTSFLAVMVAIWAALRPQELKEFLELITEERGGPISLPIAVFVLAITMNIFGDYVSLIETRWVLTKLIASSWIRKLVWMAIDLVLTLIIFCMALSLAEGFIVIALTLSILDDIISDLSLFEFLSFFFSLIGFAIQGGLRTVFEDGVFLSNGGGKNITFGIFMYTTYFTSLWIALFFFGGILLRTSIGVIRAFRILRWGMGANVKTHPIRSIGLAAALPAFIVATAFGLMVVF